MKIYQAHYETQEGLGPKPALEYECEQLQTQGALEIFTKDYSYYGGKAYILDTDTNEIIEIYVAHPLYTLSSVLLVSYAAILLLTGFETSLADLFGELFATVLPVSAIIVAFVPEMIINRQPNGFRTANYPDNKLPDMQPVAFLNKVTFSKLVYLNYISAGILLHSEIFNSIHILSPVYFLGIGAIILLQKNAHDPATDKTVFLSVFALFPYGITTLNLLIYSQWERMIIDVIDVWVRTIQLTNELVAKIVQVSLIGLNTDQGKIIAEFTRNLIASLRFVSELLAAISQTPLVGLIITNLLILYVLTHLKQNLDSPSDPFGMYTHPPNITDKKYLRIGMSLILCVYIMTSLGILLSQLFGYPFIPIGAVTSGILIFWPLGIILPAGIAVWYRHRSDRTAINDIDVGNHQFEIESIPVVVKDIIKKGKLAFVLPNSGKPVIIVDQQLCNKLSDDEMKAICYHELYHVNHDSIRYQTRIETPIIGTLLFFLFTNLEKIYNDEYRADEFAAQQVSAETVIDALRKAESLKQTNDKSKIKAEIDQGWWGYLELFCSPPVLSIYSPPTKDRIMRLEALSI
ncbi:Zn-dependent protease with chaperone function [Halohasta litchfieldiae]|uniref:Zn-dependent protease with chaperone function n=1 Tax=Halohasta litchfieldiae TaxID=1073996 RepID=A0A1H6XE91_9EURY|nr:M48 family metalloprotease [Halohasta litchfieldiae]ATW88298.1 Zn-dependent protease with chaperone function [Halohasta litchfieldiae]SEJ27438.1 Zn-dependent protease with chaperone function [Halohasta litchfieldiae]